ncbi:MAG: family transcriptional regulator, cyclic receptor protein [Mycobacterium sp.]|nr:family transcriptional regulator, cyclic receptor protein [Mycobacterium sp.]
MAWTCDRTDLAVLVRAFQGVEPVEVLTEQLQPVEFPCGHTIYTEGDQADCLYIVIAGKVKIGRRSPDGRERMMGIMGPADMFGAVSMFDSGSRTADASAVTDVRAVSMDRIALRILMTDCPEMAEQLLRVLARRLRLTDNTVAALISADGPGRLAKQLLQMAQRFGRHEDGGLRVTHDLTQEELAHLIGASRETVNKALANFTNRGWLRVDGRSVLIFEPERLARRAR